MIPADVLTSLENGLYSAIEIAGLVFIILVGIHAFMYMRDAIGGGSSDEYKPTRKELAAMNREAMYDNFYIRREESRQVADSYTDGVWVNPNASVQEYSDVMSAEDEERMWAKETRKDQEYRSPL